MVKTALYRPTGQRVTVGRKLRDDDGNLYYTVTPTDVKQGEYARSYQATEQDLQYDDGPHPMAPGAPTGQVIPFASNSAPEIPRVPRDQEPPSGIDPSQLIWVNDPTLGKEYIATKIKGIGVLSAEKILEVRAEQPGGVYSSLDDIPLRIDSLKKYFSLVQINMNPDVG